MRKPAWLPYFHAFGFGDRAGLALMPVVGMIDILVGLVTLVWPRRAVLLWMTFWAVFTALLRPLAEEPWWEVIERAGNYGPPLALLVLSGWPRGSGEWWRPIPPRDSAWAEPVRIARVAAILRVTTGLLLIGHGGFGVFMHKAMLERHYVVAGLSALPLGIGTLARAVGGFEIVLGLVAMAWPLAPLLLFVVAWKVATEMLYPVSGAPFWEFVERAGSYGAPLALYWVMFRRAARSPAGHPAAVPAPRPG
jgi:hypothetical protein